MSDITHLECCLRQLQLTADGSEDAVEYMYNLEGAPELRRLWMAICGLDDLIASGQAELPLLQELRCELLHILLNGSIISADDSVEYGEAIYIITTVYSQTPCELYRRLQGIHLEMLAIEARAAASAACGFER